MYKKELVNLIHSAVNNDLKVSKKVVDKVLNAFMQSVKSSVAEGNEVKLEKFGTFKMTTHKARRGYNVQTKEVIDIPERILPTFKISKHFLN